MAAHSFSHAMMDRVFGKDRLSAVLSGIAPGTRTRYLTSWHHWEQFMTARQMSPWIWRTNPDWGDNLIYYILSESKVLANAPKTISGEVSGVRFWHLLVGMPDFTLGGGRCAQVLQKYPTRQPGESEDSRNTGNDGSDRATSANGGAAYNWHCLRRFGRFFLVTGGRVGKPEVDGRAAIH